MVYLDRKYESLFVLYLEVNLIAKTFKNQTSDNKIQIVPINLWKKYLKKYCYNYVWFCQQSETVSN